MTRHRCMVMLMLILSSPALATQFNGLQHQWMEPDLIITPQYQVMISSKVKEAIDNGIVVTFVMQANVYQSIDWWPDDLLEAQAQTFEVRYFSLSSQYQLHNLKTKEKLSFVDLNQLLTHLGEQTVFTFHAALTANYIQTRLYLDKQALPSTMQLPIVFDSNWNLKTDWQTAPLKAGGQP